MLFAHNPHLLIISTLMNISPLLTTKDFSFDFECNGLLEPLKEWFHIFSFLDKS